MAANVTIYNFLAWIREQIEPDRLSALITGYNYTDDSDETIMDALQSYPEFKNDLGRLLGESLKNNEVELNRSVGGISFESNSLSIQDWKKIIKQNDFSRANGSPYSLLGPGGLPSGNSYGGSNATTQTKDWKGLLGGVVNVGLDFLFGKNENQNPPPADEKKKESGSSTALWIIIGVVVIAIVAILWLSLSKK